MSRFTLKMNVYPFIFLETTNMGVGTLRTGFVFPRQSNLGVTWIGLV